MIHTTAAAWAGPVPAVVVQVDFAVAHMMVSDALMALDVGEDGAVNQSCDEAREEIHEEEVETLADRMLLNLTEVAQ